MFLILLLLALALAGTSCSQVRAASPEALRTRVEALGKQGSTIRTRKLHQPRAVARFYQERSFEPAWTSGGRAEDVVQAIRGVERDGLTPAHYHLEAIEALIEERADADAAADLEILLADAVAGMVDHVRYGRVRPVALHPAWNVDPREETPPLETVLAEIARASSAGKAIEAAKPDHFIYSGLTGALERLRQIAAAGGWPRVAEGKSLKPGARDPRIAQVRARLRVSGELEGGRAADSTHYDPELAKAVELFQARHRLHPDGILDKTTIAAMNVPVGARIGQVRVNLERARWVLGGLDQDFLLVNLPAFKAYLIRGGRNVWESRVQIGEEARQTPSFRDRIETVVFNPDWTVPPTILEKDVLAGMRRGEDMIARKRLTILDAQGNEVDPSSIDWDSATGSSFPYTLRQPPGRDNALGRVKFLFPNRYSIYLHDTPHRELFEAERRTFSSGCIRVEQPLELAERLLGWPASRVQEALETTQTRNVNLDEPLPIVIVYWTVSVGATGEIRYTRDVYGHDGPLLAALGGGTGRAARAAASSS